MLSNKGLGDTIDPTGYFPDADSLVIMAFGDESGIGYNMDGNYPSSGPPGQLERVKQIQE